MARTEQKVRDLVESDPGMREAVATVLEAADDGSVRWVDVREDLTSGQWGRLIEKGLLVDGEDGFVFADLEGTRAGLENGEDGPVSTGGDDEEIEGTSWSVYDKAAAVITVGLFLGYSYAPIRNVIGGTMDFALGPLAANLPFYAVVMVLASVTGLYSTILQANLMDMDKMGQYQQRMKDLQKRQKEAREEGDDEELERVQDEQMEAMGDQMGMFKEQFRPMVWIMFFTIPVFLWMYWAVGIGGGSSAHVELSTIVMPILGQAEWTTSVLGPMQTWIVWYFLCSMAFTQIIRKGLDIDMTPSTS
jgi:uncharacterized membrane protein (DUF106 family)